MSYRCVCGKDFSTYRKMTGHMGKCPIYLKYKQDIINSYTIKCPACNRMFENKNSLNAHLSHCELYTKQDQIYKRKTDLYKQNDNTYKCPKCCKIFNNLKSLIPHMSWCGTNRKSWFQLKSLPEYHDKFKLAIEKSKDKIKLMYQNGYNQKSTGRADTKEKELERKKKISISMKKYGGKRNHSGRGKQGRYKGYWCDSSWELAYVIYNLEHNIKFIRSDKEIIYKFNNIEHKYYPDFELEDGTLIEIKGYETEQWKEKQLECIKKYNLVVLNKDTIKPYLEYTINKYGKNYINLYEK